MSEIRSFTVEELYKKHPNKRFFKLFYCDPSLIKTGLYINQSFNSRHIDYLDDIIPLEEIYNSFHYVYAFCDNPLYPTVICEIFFNGEASDAIIKDLLFDCYCYVPNIYICGEPMEFSPFMFDVKEPTMRGEKISKESINDKYELYKLLLSHNGLLLHYIKEQTGELCEIAVKQNGMAIKDVQEELLTYKLYKSAVQNTGLALKYIKNQTQELCQLAVENFVDAFEFVEPEFLTPELCKYAVKSDGTLIKYIKNQTYELCELAIEQTQDAYYHIDDEFKTLIIRNEQLSKQKN